MSEWVKRKNLIYELALKDLKIRYSRPILGFIWAFLLPFFTALIFYVFFSKLLKVKTDEAPFFLYLMSGVFPWQFFQSSFFQSITSLVDNKNLLKESNFPHYLIVVSIVLANAINFLPSLFILLLVSIVVLKGVSIFIVLLPLVLMVHFCIIVGLSIIFSILYVKWRDVRYIIEIVLLLLFYLTPVFYSIYLIKAISPLLLFKIYTYNPFAGILSLYRIIVLKGFYVNIQKDISFLSIFGIPVLFAMVLLLSAYYFYKRNKDIINDYLAY